MTGNIIAIENTPGLEKPMIYPGFNTTEDAWDFIKDKRTCSDCARAHQGGTPLAETHCGSHWTFTTREEFKPEAGEYQSYISDCEILNQNK